MSVVILIYLYLRINTIYNLAMLYCAIFVFKGTEVPDDVIHVQEQMDCFMLSYL